MSGYGSNQVKINVTGNEVTTSNLLANGNVDIGGMASGYYNDIVGNNLTGLNSGLILGITSSAFSVYGNTGSMIGVGLTSLIGLTSITSMVNCDTILNKSTFSDEIDAGYFLSNQYMLESSCLPFNSPMAVGITIGDVIINSIPATAGVGWSYISVSQTGQYQTATVNGGGIWISSDYGNTWIQTNFNNNAWTSVSLSASGKFQTAAASVGAIWYSVNYGNTWNEVMATNSNSWVSVSVSASGEYQAAVNTAGMWYSSNYGFSWTLAAGTSSIISFAISVSASGQYQSATEFGGGIYYSSNYGHSWTKSNAPNRSWISISVSYPGQYQTAVAGTVGIYYSSDFGNTWTQSVTAGTNSLLTVSVSSLGKYQIAAGSGPIFYSFNYGQNWDQVSTNFSSITSIAISGSGSYFSIAGKQIGTQTIYQGIIPVTSNFSINGQAYKSSGPLWTTISDERLKNIHGEFTEGIEVLNKLESFSFTYKNDSTLQTGVIAQKMLDVYPKCISELNGYYCVDSNDFLYLCINTLKKQNQRMIKNGQEIQNLKNKLNLS